MPALDKPHLRPTWVTIDLGALIYNFGVITRQLPKGVGVMAMVKADAYGHGAAQVSRALEGAGVDALGVATVEEGLELRDAHISKPVLVMGGLMGAGAAASEKVAEANLTPVIHSADVIGSIEAAAAKAGRAIGVHLKIDTGMSRLGVRPESLPHLLSKLRTCRHVKVEGVMTHLADAWDDEVSAAQVELFSSCRDEVENALGPVELWHAANSLAILKGDHVDIPLAPKAWARPGLALYGTCRGVDFCGEKLMPVMSLVSRAVLLKRVPAGTRVSYEGTFTTARPSRLAIVPIGYADGYPWSASGRASVLIRGRRAPVLGRVTMDMIVVDVTDIEDVSVNDEVILLGRQGGESITVDELAGWAGTITYEIMCRVSKRMPRIYKPVKRET